MGDREATISVIAAARLVRRVEILAAGEVGGRDALGDERESEEGCPGVVSRERSISLEENANGSDLMRRKFAGVSWEFSWAKWAARFPCYAGEVHVWTRAGGGRRSQSDRPGVRCHEVPCKEQPDRTARLAQGSAMKDVCAIRRWQLIAVSHVAVMTEQEPKEATSPSCHRLRACPLQAS